MTGPASGDPVRCDICGPHGALAVRLVTAESEDVSDTTARWTCLAHLPTATETVGLAGKRAMKVIPICRPDPRRPR